MPDPLGDHPRGDYPRNILASEQFPRASHYDPVWVLQNEMGLNALWLAEFLTEAMDLRPGMNVLDLGCGKALSSIFLAAEFGVHVSACDLWIGEDENRARIETAGLADKITPVCANAKSLPFADEFFDAIISIDAFEYFGMEETFLPTLVRLLKPGGQIGAVNASVTRETDILPPEWPADFVNFHSADWWRHHWSLCNQMDVEFSDYLPVGRELWLKWNKITGVTDDTWLTDPLGETLGFGRIVGRRSGR